MDQYDRAALAKKLVQLSPQEIEELRAEQLTKDQAEAECRARLKLPDGHGSIRMYSGFDYRALLVRTVENPDDYIVGDHAISWMPFTTYRMESLLDWQLKHDKLSEPVAVLTAEQMGELGL